MVVVVIIMSTIKTNNDYDDNYDNDKACSGGNDDYHGDNGVDGDVVAVNMNKQLNLCPNFH